MVVVGQRSRVHCFVPVTQRMALQSGSARHLCSHVSSPPALSDDSVLGLAGGERAEAGQLETLVAAAAGAKLECETWRALGFQPKVVVWRTWGGAEERGA